MRSFKVVLIPEPEGGFSVAVPGLEGCLSQGETEDEALEQIKEAMELYCESIIDLGEPIPNDVDAVDVSAYPAGSLVRSVQIDL